MTHARVSGKFLTVGGDRYLIRGVSYGTFAPDADGVQFPTRDRIAQDFGLMAAAGINTVRIYTPPPVHLLDEAAEHGLRVMIGLPWSQHIAFLSDRELARRIRRETAEYVRTLGAHPAALMFAVGNEIPPSVVRWHGAARVEDFLREICADAKAASPDSLLTYVNYPPTEYLDTECFDVASFNVYLHRESDLRAYLARLQQVAGNKPLLLAEAGADSIREGADGQARITAMHLRAAFNEGLCGAVAFSWTDEWWRGGHDVDDWAFGLVDRDRQPKPALTAVTDAFDAAPFSATERARWPKVSVVVCAYNAADTLDDCLASLQQLDYPEFEIILVNDGSRDQTGDIGARYAGAWTPPAGVRSSLRVINIPNGGLSAARNLGLAEATGEIVAYTDADVRVEPDWLMYLVQPFLTSDVVGSGGPNVIPHDDAWVAQCVARSPGGPTHVLLDDRIAEHVPGCNMAFRRDALLAIGGFNPVYLRAGDDVDVCWRLQAKKQRIGFAPSALVWHHHRASVKAYWRQQVGYGEGETWLDAHHPEKFVRGNMLWRGRIYSPLPFVRSLSGRRINTGVWGTAAFPSVYRTDVLSYQFLPHLPAWWFASTALCLAGVGTLFTRFLVIAGILLSLGVLGWLTTIGRCLTFGWSTDLSDLGVTGRTAALRYRLLISWMHFIQPIARFYGRVRGMLNPPPVIESGRVTRFPWKAPVPSVSDLLSTTALLAGAGSEETYWGERWTSHDAVLSELAGLLRSARPARSVDIDDGWRADRDVSVAVSRWGWVDARVLLEEHGGPKVLFRVGTKLRPTLKGITLAFTLAISAIAATSAAIFFKWPWLSLPTAAFVAVVFTRAAWGTARAVAVMRRAVERATGAAGMIRVPVRASSRRTRRLSPYPVAISQMVQSVVALALTCSAVLTGSSVVSDIMTISARRPVALSVAKVMPPELDISGSLAVAPNGDLFFADGKHGVIRQFDTRPYEQPPRNRPAAAISQRQFASLQFASPSDVAVSANGDFFVADAQNDRICRIDRANGKIVTVAGSGVAGFDGDLKQATQAALHAPNAVAVARNGDLYIADTNNNRVRVVEQATGVIRTLAGDGIGGSGALIGDGGPAVHAHLDHPTDVAVAPNGDLYIADMGHHRVRMIEAKTGIITTVAGDGLDAMRGDGGPAVAASLSGPAGVAVVPSGRRVVLYIADYHNNRVRMVGVDGRISTVPGLEKFSSPSRLAMRPGGWLYVSNDSGAVTAVNVNKVPFQLATVPPPTPEPLRTAPPVETLRTVPPVIAARKVT